MTKAADERVLAAVADWTDDEFRLAFGFDRPQGDEGDIAWLDFEPEPDTTGDGAGDPDKHILTIAAGFGTNHWPEEVAVIVHRTVNGKYPLDGALARQKRHNAQVICDALNANHNGETHAEKLFQGER